MRRSIRLLCLVASVLVACAKSLPEPQEAPVEAPSQAKPPAPRDPSSYAQPDLVRVKHLALDLRVDFQAQALTGTVTLDLAWQTPTASEVVLDTRDLHIHKVEADDGKGFCELPFQLAPRDPAFGTKLTIPVPSQVPRVRITYATSSDASGLLWLTPEMTAGKTHPFMFSQSQTIHARSWVPLQDTPSVRFTYEARIETPPTLMALMSADNDPNAARDGEYRFTMPEPIPSYLLALAVGDLTFSPISERSGVWAEPSVVDAAVREFADTERMMQTAESLYGSYRWGRYDILVLPPSFPYGGMENPRLTFVTPTVIVGDKSLVSLIAHELAHSWSGNLVTNASWNDSWLNEGFTSYVENRIVEALYGAEAARMETVIAQDGLLRELERIPEADQLLALPPFSDRDPESVMTDVAYTKGQWFLQFLEQRFGREAFDAFLRRWFDKHAFQSTSTDEFERFLRDELVAAHPGKVTDQELHAFLREPGVPRFAERARSVRLEAVDAARAQWFAGRPLNELPYADWGTHERVRFLEGMPEVLSHAQLRELDEALALSGTQNGEIAMRWYPLTIRSGYEAARPAMREFLLKIGRRKLIQPIYEALVGSEEGRAFAKAVYKEARPGYHPIARRSIERMLEN